MAHSPKQVINSPLKEMKTAEEATVKASTHFNIWVTCPHCDSYQDHTDKLKEHLTRGELREEHIDCELKCEDCNEIFYVDEIEY